MKKLSIPIILLIFSITLLAQSSPDDFIWVEGGQFEMGSENGQVDEKPVHTVHLDGFYIAKYEVTVAEFREFVNSTKYETSAEQRSESLKWTGCTWNKKGNINWQCDANGIPRDKKEDNHPVLHVSWEDAQAFCQWKSETTGEKYRLPTEAEWEFAATDRGEAIEWAGTNDEKQLSRCANFNNKDLLTKPVGSYEPNTLGIYDLSGNVSEWVEDVYSSSFYEKSEGAKNPCNQSIDQRWDFRVHRGGCWFDRAVKNRVKNRSNNYSYHSGAIIGFRLVRE